MTDYGEVIRCGGCHRPFAASTPLRRLGGIFYCLVCAADIENARRT